MTTVAEFSSILQNVSDDWRLVMLTGIGVGMCLAAVLNGVRIWRILKLRRPGSLYHGVWSVTPSDGGIDMTPFQRAVVAVTGLWAMTRKEALYFTATHDSDGKPFDCRESYLISGTDLPAVWWSVTVYRNLYFIKNSANRYSRSSSNITREKNGRWSIRLSAHGSDPNGIAMGVQRGLITVILRLYVPDPLELVDILGKLPSIYRVDSTQVTSDSGTSA
jgi:hypothetical protein